MSVQGNVKQIRDLIDFNVFSGFFTEFIEDNVRKYSKNLGPH